LKNKSAAKRHSLLTEQLGMSLSPTSDGRSTFIDYAKQERAIKEERKPAKER
jgi:hypothetical protein